MSDYGHITNFLDKFKKILFKKEETVFVLQEILLKEIGLNISNKDIVVKTPLVIINGSPVFKNELFLKKEKILKTLNDQLPDCRINDIR